MRRLLVVLLVFVMPMVGQVAGGPAFEVATIRPHPDGVNGKIGFYGTAGGRVELGMCRLPMLVMYALDVDMKLISGGPDWGAKVFYDIHAVPPESSPSRQLALPGYMATPTSEQRAMILNLLVERFGLRYHFEEKEMPVYLLERGKGPLKMQAPEHAERNSDPRGGLLMYGDASPEGMLATGEGFGENVTMAALAHGLMWPLERPVIDRTGLSGNYDFRVAPIEPGNHDKVRAAMLMTQALGLKLTAGHAPVKTVVIDAATPPTPN